MRRALSVRLETFGFRRHRVPPCGSAWARTASAQDRDGQRQAGTRSGPDPQDADGKLANRCAEHADESPDPVRGPPGDGRHARGGRMLNRTTWALVVVATAALACAKKPGAHGAGGAVGAGGRGAATGTAGKGDNGDQGGGGGTTLGAGGG